MWLLDGACVLGSDRRIQSINELTASKRIKITELKQVAQTMLTFTARNAVDTEIKNLEGTLVHYTKKINKIKVVRDHALGRLMQLELLMNDIGVGYDW